MHWLSSWWRHDIVDGHKGPLLLGLVAFVVTFVVVRTITRLIRAGRGPFHNVNDGGVHLHHSTPGVVLLVTGGFTSVGADGRSPWTYLAATMVGVGASLVLDEFAMIFHLQDVYWSQEGQLSVSMVTLVAACVALPLVGFSPTGATGLTPAQSTARGVVTALLVLHLVLVVLAAVKGKYGTAVIGLFLAPVTWVAVLRLARPHSLWSRWFYAPERRDRATRRAAAFDARWAPRRQWWDDLIGGAPSRPDPTTPARSSAGTPPSAGTGTSSGAG